MSEWDNEASEHDHAVSAVYRKAADLSPPTSLDNAILAAARQAAWRRKQRWMLPLSTAAVVMFSVTLLLNMHDEWDFSREEGGDSPTSPILPSASRPVSRSAEKPKPALPAAPQEIAVEVESYREEAADILAKRLTPPAPSSLTAKPKKAAPSSKDLTTETAGKSTPAPPGELIDQAARSRAQSSGVLAFSNDFSTLADSADEEADKKKPSLEPGKAVIKQPVNKDVVRMERGEQALLAPKPWLAKIRELITAGKTETARKELEFFKKRYPDHMLPDDLKSFTKLQEDIPASH